MPNDKRQRQKEARIARLEAIRSAERAAMRRKQTMYAVGAIAVVALLALFAVTRDDDSQDVSTASPSTTTPGATTTPEGQPPAHDACTQTPPTTRPTPFDQTIDPAKTYLAHVETDVGSFTIELAAQKAPKTVNNFVNLARAGFYDCVAFHRVIPGFVVQGGDGTEGTGRGGPGYQFEDELPQAGEYQVGSVAMANSGPNTNGSQFFVVTGDQGAQLPPSYSLFGKVTEGMDVVKAIEADGSDEGTPTTVHVMTSVTIEEK